MGEKDTDTLQIEMPGLKAPKLPPSTPQYENPLNKEKQTSPPDESNIKSLEIPSPKPRDLVDLIETEVKSVRGHKTEHHHLPNSSIIVEGNKTEASLMVLDETVTGLQARSFRNQMKKAGISLGQVRAIVKYADKNVEEAIDFCSDPKHRLDIVHYVNLFKGIDGIDDRFHD